MKGIANCVPVQVPAPGPMEGFGVELELTQGDELDEALLEAETKAQ